MKVKDLMAVIGDGYQQVRIMTTKFQIAYDGLQVDWKGQFKEEKIYYMSAIENTVWMVIE